MLEQRNRSASNYAKAKVDQIRKKFGYPTNSQISLTSDRSIVKNPKPTISSNNKENSNTTPAVSQLSKPQINLPARTQLNKFIGGLSQKPYHQYENRIRNINSINKRIENMLKQKQRIVISKPKEETQSKETNNFVFGLNLAPSQIVPITNQGFTYQQNQQQERRSLQKIDIKNYQSQSRQSIPKMISPNFQNSPINKLPESIITRAQQIYQKQSILTKNFIKFQDQHNLNANLAQKEQSYVRHLENKLGTNTFQPITARAEYAGLNSKYTVSIQLPQNLDNAFKNQNIPKRQSQKQVKSQPTQKLIDKPQPKIAVQQVKVYQNKTTHQTQQKVGKLKEISKKQTIKLAEALNEQILRDQSLRFAKWVFSEWQNPNKWVLLKQKLPSYLPQQIEKIFTLSSEQHNPFFQLSETPSQKCIQTLVQAYENAKKYWQENVKQCASIQNLQDQYFSLRDIDLGKKGYLTVEDIVCFVNLHTGKFYRNRDAFGLFKRFVKQLDKGSEQVKYQWFLDILTK